jgi:amidase
MTPEEYRQHDATALADLIRRGEVSLGEVVDTAISRAEAINPQLNAICLPRYDKAREDRPGTDAPFAGAPFLAKDLAQEMAGMPCTMGSRALRRNIPAQDSEYIKGCRNAGLVILGRTATPELGLKGITESRLWGPTRNPWDRARTPGGSSGGSGAAVAAGIVPMAGANDGGGSIRIPAAYNGLFGLKPSRGRVSAGPYMGEYWTGASIDHVVSRSVRDSAGLLDCIAGNPKGDPFRIEPPAQPYAQAIKSAPRPLRIGFFTESPYGTEVAPEAAMAIEATARQLEDLGHHVEPAAPAYNGMDLARAYLSLNFGEVATAMAEARDTLGARDSDYEVETRLLGTLGNSMRAMDYVRVRRQWNDFARALGAYFDQYDMYLCPTTAQPPARIGELETPIHLKMAARLMVGLKAGTLALKSGIVDDLAQESLARVPFTQLANLTGTPAMSVPLYWNEQGLPVGVQFGAPHGGETELFQLAAQLEEAHPWSSYYQKIQL